MEKNIDISKRKPRRTRGTPSYYYRNRFAWAVIATGSLLFAGFACIPQVRQTNEKVKKYFYYRTEEEIERRELFSFIRQRRGDEIREILEHKEKVRTER